jgi:hypothetical protein
MRDPTVRARFADEASAPLLAAYEAGRARAPQIIGLLSDDDPDVRATAALLLVLLSHAAAEAAPALAEALARERKAAPRASMAMAVGLVGRAAGSEAGLATLRELAHGKNGLVAAGACLGLVWALEGDVDAAILDRLAGFAEDRPKTPRRFPWGDVGALAERVLFRVRPPDPDVLLDALAEVATPDGMDPRWKVAQRLKYKAQLLLFGATRREADPWLPQELTPARRRLLELVYEHELGLSSPGYHGLPRRPKGIARLLGRHVGPLDAEIALSVDREERRWPVWRVVRAALDHALPLEEAVDAIREGIDPTARDALLDDLADVAHGWDLRVAPESWGYLEPDEKAARVSRLEADLAALEEALRTG